MSKKNHVLPANKTELRALVAQMTDTYLANGGKIRVIKPGRRHERAIDETAIEKVSGEVK